MHLNKFIGKHTNGGEMMKKERYGFCAECRTTSPYELRTVTRKCNIRDKDYNMEVTVAFCKNCGEEVNVPGLMDLRTKEIDSQYRKIENIVTINEIEKLMEIYNIGKGPASLALGFGEVTITRYIQGQVPSKEYSDIIRKALEFPEFMIEQLNKNKEKIGEIAYKKAIKAANELLKIFDVSEKMLSTISYIFEKGHEVTPLALQKLLYFIQGISLLVFRKPLYVEDCQAWAHGPVYKSVYELFKTFKYSPIDDNRFVVFKNRFQKLTEDEKRIIDLVMDTFGIYSAKTLERITHNEKPWISAREGYMPMEYSNVVIEKEAIISYYDDVYKQFDIKNSEGLNLYIKKQLGFV